MRSTRIRLALFAACSFVLALPAIASAQTPIVLDGTIPAGTPRYFTIPFTVPDGIHEIEVRHDDLSATNILDWGLRDPMRFRGWGGGNTEAAIVSDTAASRSYLTGPIMAGQWSVMIGQAKVVDAPAQYHIEIYLRTAATIATQPERRPYVNAPALSTGPRWYAGDFHVHSRESGDASPTLDDIATFAHTRGLDFVELSDHNTVSQLDYIDDSQSRHPDLLLLPGFEFTTYAGHANAIGATQWVDFTAGTGPGVTIQPALDAIDALGAVFAINHPVLDLGDQCIGCAWTLDVPHDRVSGIEIQNGAYSQTGALFYRRAMMFWDSYLVSGHHVAPLGGSDDHSGAIAMGQFFSPIGGPTTMVYATELSAAAIIAGVAAGRTVVKLEGPGDPMVELNAGSAMIGDTVNARHVTLRATVTHGMGASLRFVHNGLSQSIIAVDADPFMTTLDVDAPPGTADDRWRCELSVNGSPRVVTGHVWIAATGDPIPVDAGNTADVATAPMDAGNPTRTNSGCGCRTLPTTKSSSLGALALVALMCWSRRRLKPAA